MKPDEYAASAKVLLTGRTPAEEVAVMRRRTDKLFAKEARCPGCAKTKRLAAEASKVVSPAVEWQEGTLDPGVCEVHIIIRRQMAYRD